MNLDTPTPSHLYRFRATKYLLDPEYQELEGQEIYFSSPTEWNDPIEGYKNIVWRGDQIAWQNLLNSFLLNLFWLATIWPLGGAEPIEEQFTFLRNESHFQNDKAHAIYTQAKRNFYNKTIAQNYPQLLTARSTPIYRAELSHHLDILLPNCLSAISAAFEENGLPPIFGDDSNYALTDFLLFDILNGSSNRVEMSKVLFDTWQKTQSSLYLKFHYMNSLMKKDERLPFFFNDFPNHFLNLLESLIHPRWYSACFTTAHDNASLWGYYGTSHTGVALKFRVNRESSEALSIPLVGITGFTKGKDKIAPTYNERQMRFQRISYQNKHPEVEFFRSLNLPMQELMRDWYSDESKRVSICANHLTSDHEKEWRNRYWKLFDETASTKHEHWRHEEEYRLILTEMSISYADKTHRKLRYNFSDLDGITFGIKTRLTDKVKIIEIIDNKCKAEGRKHFDFQQAYYDADAGIVKSHKLDILTS